jgi:hypothetical protein
VGWVRLIPGDCLGIPIFTDGSNTEFIPETDNRLRIVAFHAFYNDEGYGVDRDLPVGVQSIAYCVGSGVPIPFSMGGMTQFVDSEQTVVQFRQRFTEQIQREVVQSVLAILDKAETGTFDKYHVARKVQAFEELYSDLFKNPPVHSRYWIERFRTAAMKLGQLAPEEQRTLRLKLESRASDWLERYMSSGDHPTLDLFLAATERVGYGPGKPVYFRLACHLLASQDEKFVGSTLMNQVIHRIPEGLYYFEFGSAVEMHTRLRTSGLDLILYMRSAIRHGYSALDFRRAFVLANLIFGDQPMAPDVHSLAAEFADDLVVRTNREVDWFLDHPSIETFEPVMRLGESLKTLRRMLDWDRRFTPSSLPLGLSRRADELIYRSEEVKIRLRDFSWNTNLFL